MDAAKARIDAGYWRFALPLAVLGPLMTIGGMAQQAALLSLSEGIRELAAFTLANAVLNPFANVLGMAPEMSTVLGSDRSGYRSTRRLVLIVGLVLTGIVALLGLTSLGASIISTCFHAERGLVTAVGDYLFWFGLAIPFGGMQSVSTGTLVRAGRTGTVTLLKVGDIAATIALLVFGAQFGWTTRVILIVSRLVPAVVAAVVSSILAAPHVPRIDAGTTTSTWAALRYFAPLAVTTSMFTLSRPILFALVTASLGAGLASETMVAAMSLAFSVGFLFQSMINKALRQLLATRIAVDPTGCRRFALQFTAVLTVVAVLGLSGPGVHALLTVMGAEGEVLRLAAEAAPILALAPLAIAWRNWYHGLAMAHRRTGSMAYGSLWRNGCVVVCALACSTLGILDHRSGAAIMVLAFAAEAVGTIVASRRWRTDLAGSAHGRLGQA